MREHASDAIYSTFLAFLGLTMNGRRPRTPLSLLDKKSMALMKWLPKKKKRHETSFRQKRVENIYMLFYATRSIRSTTSSPSETSLEINWTSLRLQYHTYEASSSSPFCSHLLDIYETYNICIRCWLWKSNCKIRYK